MSLLIFSIIALCIQITIFIWVLVNYKKFIKEYRRLIWKILRRTYRHSNYKEQIQ